MTNVLVTRPERQAEPLCKLLEQHGVQAVNLPLLDIRPLPLVNDRLLLFKESAKVDWLIFVSANAVNFALTAVGGGMLDYCRSIRIAAVGQATAKALNAFGLIVNAVPEQGFNSEALMAMAEFQQVQGQRIVCVRGVGGRELLAETLRSRGAQVDYLEVYQRVPSTVDPMAFKALIEKNAPDVITVSSGEALSTLIEKLETESLRTLLLAIPLVVISDRLRLLAMALGFKRIAVSGDPSDAAVLKTIISLVSGECSG